MAADALPPMPPRSPAIAREGIDDVVTGLPLLRYRFDGTPTLRPADALPIGAWRVLRVERGALGCVLDTETRSGAAPVTEDPGAVDDALVSEALAVLARAARCGAAHGDLGPHRLWRRGSEVWVEGYGVPWSAVASPAEDARSLAEGLRSLDGVRLSDRMRARLEAVAATGDPTATGDAAAAVVPSAAGEPIAALAPIAAVASSVAPIAAVAPSVSPAPPTRPAAPREAALVAPRHVHLGVALAAASLVWLLLALATWPSPAVDDPTFSGTARLIDVRVEPEGRAPVRLVVLASPTGSRHAPEAVVGAVPGRVALDRDGVWRFAAEFAGRRSGTIELVVPRDAVLVVPFPEPHGATAP